MNREVIVIDDSDENDEINDNVRMNREVIVINDNDDSDENDDSQQFTCALNKITQLVSRPMTERQFNSCVAMLNAFVKENVRFTITEDFQLDLIDNVTPLYERTHMNTTLYRDTAYKTILVVLKKLSEEIGVNFDIE